MLLGSAKRNAKCNDRLSYMQVLGQHLFSLVPNCIAHDGKHSRAKSKGRKNGEQHKRVCGIRVSFRSLPILTLTYTVLVYVYFMHGGCCRPYMMVFHSL